LFFENLDTLIILKIREKYIAKNNQLNEDEELLNVIEKKFISLPQRQKGITKYSSVMKIGNLKVVV
jgi:hypothetical protein